MNYKDALCLSWGMVSVLETVEATIVGVLKVSNPQYLRKERVLGAVKPFSGV